MPVQKRSLGATPLWVVILLGGAVTALGFYVQTNGSSTTNQMIAGTLGAIGGGVIGAAISLYLSANEGRDAVSSVTRKAESSLEDMARKTERSLDELRDFVKNSLGTGMRSDERSLLWIRRQWNYYYLTQQKGVKVWRHFVYRFDESLVHNSIVVRTYDEVDGNPYWMRTEVAIIGDRLIMVETPFSGAEPANISITTDFADDYLAVRAGLVVLRSWDKTSLVSRCLWSANEIVPSVNRAVREDHTKTLDDHWEQNVGEPRNNFLTIST